VHRRHIDCLKRVRKHVGATDIALTGGLAIELQLRRLGFRGRSLGDDLDFVAKSLDAVPPSVTSDFLVVHYHVLQPKFLVMLVDPVSRIRVDIFPDLVGSIETAEELHIEDCRVNVLRLAAMFAHKVLILETAASLERTVDPKHYRDALALGELIGSRPPDVPKKLMVPDIYSTDVNQYCAKCETNVSTSFRLSPKQEIFDILGYV